MEENIHKFTSFEYGSDESHTSLLTGNVPVPPQGLIWDGANYSCAYDAFFSILQHLWCQDPPHWTQQFSNVSPTLHGLANGFQLVSSHNITFEQLRDDVRHSLHNQYGNMFPYGKVGTSVMDLANKVVNNEELNASYQLECTNCQFIGDVLNDYLSPLIFNSSSGISSTKDQLRSTLVRRSRLFCPECLSQ